MLNRLLLIVSILLLVQVHAAIGLSAATDFVVDRHADGTGARDSAPGDGVCLSVGGGCTLRAAIEEANARAGGDIIRFSHAMTITIDATAGALPTITDKVTITASDLFDDTKGTPGVTLDGNGADIDGLRIDADVCGIYGLFVTGFAGRGIVLESAGSFIGSGAIAGARNTISGNGTGIELDGTGATGNFVDANLIGLSPDGTEALANRFGMKVVNGASNNTIGYQLGGSGNWISGNTYSGIRITGDGTSGNVVAGNVIGRAIDGSEPLGNGDFGVMVARAGEGNQIGGEGHLGNRIGYSGSDNIYINYMSDVLITGNVIAFAGQHGVSINHSQDITVVANKITLNTTDGIKVNGDVMTGNRLTPNSIHDNGGKAIDLTAAAAARIPAPSITAGSPMTATGTACPQCAVDLFSDVADEGETYNGASWADIDGRWAYTGTLDGPNLTAVAVALDGSTSEYSAPFDIAGPRSYVVDDDIDGLEARDVRPGDGQCRDVSGACTLRAAIEEANATSAADTITFARPMTITLDATVMPRLIVSETVTLDGSNVSDPAGHAPRVHIIGGSAFTTLSLDADDCVIAGLHLSGGDTGLHVRSASNEIGGLAGRRNVFSGNRVGLRISGPDAELNHVLGNFVGLMPEGERAAGNEMGVQIDGGAKNNFVGAFATGTGNVISGNRGAGIVIEDQDTHFNVLSANLIGLAADGIASLGNGGFGVHARNGAQATLIGPYTEEGLKLASAAALPSHDGRTWRMALAAMEDPEFLPNTIAHNGAGGILLSATSRAAAIGSNTIRNNTGHGIQLVDATDAWISRNRITANTGNGVTIAGVPSTGNTLINNAIFANGGQAIDLQTGANGSIFAPTISQASPTGASGTACSECWVELFSDDEDEAQHYEGGTQASVNGDWSFVLSLRGPFVTASQTDDEGESSELSAPRAILPTATPTITPGTTATAFPTKPAPTTTPSASATATATASPTLSSTQPPPATVIPTTTPSATTSPTPAPPTATSVPTAEPTATDPAMPTPTMLPTDAPTPTMAPTATEVSVPRFLVHLPYLLRSPPH